MTDHLIAWQDGSLGRLKLNRPKALNALTFEMARGIGEALEAWRSDDEVSAIVIEGEGERAFCAGGDILHLYNVGRETPEVGHQFWRDEYRINAMIAHYPKPYISLMDGIVMGGGVGVSAHGSHRIVTERSMVAMPEVSIGFLPDVGGTYILSRAPGYTGLFLGMTGTRMDAADAIYAGFADAYIPSENLESFLSLLRAGISVDEALTRVSEKPVGGSLAVTQEKISSAFQQPSALGCAMRLTGMSETGDEWALKALKAIRRNSPLSVAAAYSAIQAASELNTLEECLTLEYRFAARTLSGHDFYEGVRAAVIDKDKNPQWQPKTLEDVTLQMVADVLAPLGADEWTVS